jgi:hypothetical protein
MHCPAPMKNNLFRRKTFELTDGIEYQLYYTLFFDEEVMITDIFKNAGFS